MKRKAKEKIRTRINRSTGQIINISLERTFLNSANVKSQSDKVTEPLMIKGFFDGEKLNFIILSALKGIVPF